MYERSRNPSEHNRTAMIRLLATEDEMASLILFLKEHDVDPECTQNHPLCFFLARLLESDLKYAIPKGKHEPHEPEKVILTDTSKAARMHSRNV